MTPEEMRQKAEGMGNHLRPIAADVWNAAAEVCDRLDELLKRTPEPVVVGSEDPVVDARAAQRLWQAALESVDRNVEAGRRRDAEERRCYASKAHDLWRLLFEVQHQAERNRRASATRGDLLHDLAIIGRLVGPLLDRMHAGERVTFELGSDFEVEATHERRHDGGSPSCGFGPFSGGTVRFTARMPKEES